MRHLLRTVAVTSTLILTPARGPAAEPKKPEWTADALSMEAAACTEALVNGAWERTKRAQNVDPNMEMTPEIRKQLAPQIASMATVCECAVREAAKKVGRDDADKPEFQLFAVETVTKGKCKPSK